MFPPATMAAIASFTPSVLIAAMEKDACDENGVITIHSAVRNLTTELLLKHAEHLDTLIGLALLTEVQDA